jgi:hypothetical protein
MTARMDAMAKRNIPSHTVKRTPTVQLVIGHFTDSCSSSLNAAVVVLMMVMIVVVAAVVVHTNSIGYTFLTLKILER